VAAVRRPDYAPGMDFAANESVIYEGRPSWRSIISFYITGLIVVIVLGAIGYFAASATVGASVFAVALVIMLLWGWLKRLATRYAITDRRLRIQRGILSKHVEEARVERLQEYSTRQSFIERLLQVGTIDFDTASSQQGDLFQFKGIANPHEVARLVDQAQEAHNQRMMAGGGQTQAAQQGE
jgi:uncharacterized membrane protein YdbT with pleckstrin-like domain